MALLWCILFYALENTFLIRDSYVPPNFQRRDSKTPEFDHIPGQTMTRSKARSRLGALVFQLKVSTQKQKFKTSNFLSRNKEEVAHCLVT